MNYDYVCKGCTRRKVGCKKDCIDYLVESIQRQPERERMREEIKKQSILNEDLRYRTNSAFNKPITYNSPMHDRSTKHERD
jgi:ubiquinone/menaquinone biosynthesis C-methylase UbiE